VIADATTQNFSFTPADKGVYTFEFTATDDDGGSDSDTVLVTVENVAPLADAGADQTVAEGDLVNLPGNFSDPSAVDALYRAAKDESLIVSKEANQVLKKVRGARAEMAREKLKDEADRIRDAAAAMQAPPRGNDLSLL